MGNVLIMSRKWTAEDVPDQSGRIAVVTGANSGLGYDTAAVLAGRGAHVVLAVRNLDKGREAADRIKAASPNAVVALQELDLSSLDSVRKAADELRAAHPRIDLLINNAGLIDEFEVPLWETDPDQWWDVVSSHIRGGYLLCRSVVPWMVLRNRGRIVNLGSGQGLAAQPEYSAYAVAKSGLMRITEALAAGLEGSDVRAFDLAPGVVDTPMTR